MKAEIDGEWIDFDQVIRIGKVYVAQISPSESCYGFVVYFNKGEELGIRGDAIKIPDWKLADMQAKYPGLTGKELGRKAKEAREAVIAAIVDGKLEALRQKCIDAFMGEE